MEYWYDMCGSNLIAWASSFIFLISLIWKTRLSPLWGAGEPAPAARGWGVGDGKCAQCGESPFSPFLRLFSTIHWLYGPIFQIQVTGSVFTRLVTQLVTKSSENGFKRREFCNFNNFKAIFHYFGTLRHCYLNNRDWQYIWSTSDSVSDSNSDSTRDSIPLTWPFPPNFTRTTAPVRYTVPQVTA